MLRSKHSLHPIVDLTPKHLVAIQSSIADRIRRQHPVSGLVCEVTDTATGKYEFPLSTVSLSRNFDAYIAVSFPGAPLGFSEQLLVDSGNSTLILPRWENIQSVPSYKTDYTVLGQGAEPWGCPANIVRGPIELICANGSPLVIGNCVFYACTGDSPSDGTRTANFGAGCLNPWTASAWNTPLPGVTMQSPLSYCNLPWAEFDYAPAIQVIQRGGVNAEPAGDSFLRLYPSAPAGYVMFDIVPNCMWMSLTPKSLRIGGSLTQWPGGASGIAMVDTGGGPVFLSDPDDYVYSKAWPDDVANPDWAAGSVSCQATQASVGIEIGDSSRSYSYTIDDNAFPPAARGLTLVMCKENEFMMGQRGMNIGGISALMNSILIDYSNKQVGFKAK